MVGQVVGPPDGYLVSLRQSRSQNNYEVPDWDDGRMIWKSGYFVLKGARDHQAIYSNCPGQCGTVDPAKTWVVNASIAYHGSLIIQCVPKGSEWRNDALRSTVH
jgi:hypothetical protein